MTRVAAKVEVNHIVAGLRESRREMDRDIQKAFVQLGQRRILPKVRIAAPKVISGSLVVRATNRGGYITATGKNRRIFGVTEFGGTIRGEIRPRRAKALRLANGRYVARVTRPRTLRAQRYTRDIVDRETPRLAREGADILAAAIERRIMGTVR